MEKSISKAGRRNIIRLCLVIIIAVQSVISVYSGIHKKGYFLDEVYTYELSNLPSGTVSRIYGYLDTWQNGSFYHDVMSVDADEAFDFSIPYVNQENDVHPFLYYFVVHLVSSFFREAEFKWIGVPINIFFCVLTSVFLFMLARKISGSNMAALISVAAWGWSVGAASVAVFLRMYAMLGMWCVLFSLLLAYLLQNTGSGQTVRKRCFIGLFLVTAGGTLTQYYFLVFCFFVSLVALIYLLLKRNWLRSLVFVIAEFGGVLLAYICFPTMVVHIFDGYRGKEAFENMAASGNLKASLKQILSIISNQLFNGWGEGDCPDLYHRLYCRFPYTIYSVQDKRE